MWIAIAIIVIVVVAGVAVYLLYKPPSGTPVSILDEGTTTACQTSGDTNCKFNPASITISSGGSVTWTNKGGVAHTVTTKSGAPASFDKSLNPSDTYTLSLTTTGTYNYTCTIHPWMAATVKVS